MDKGAFEDRIFELISYMVVSARNLLDEPARYAPFRLVDSASRLVEILDEQGLGSPRLDAVRGKIEEGKMSAMDEDEVYRAFLEDLTLGLVEAMEE